MASLIRFRAELAARIVRVAHAYGASRKVPAAEMAAALLGAGLAILSSGMDDEQVGDILKQAFDLTAPLRRATEERWKRTGFKSRDPVE